LTVSDQVPGIPAYLRERVFERYFHAAPGVAHEYGGLGLGLTLARAFARGLGGDVVILNSNGGCRAQMTIPPSRLSEK